MTMRSAGKALLWVNMLLGAISLWWAIVDLHAGHNPAVSVFVSAGCLLGYFGVKAVMDTLPPASAEERGHGS